MISFSLSEEQEKRYKEWRDEQPEPPHNFIGMKEYFVFMPTTNGTGVKVVYGSNELDLTEYEKIISK